MEKKIRVDGIYDYRTIKRLSTIPVNNYLFDFRAKSFNFLQLYRFLELLKKSYSPLNRYFLKFEGEKDFVVNKFIKDIDELSGELDCGGKLDNYILEFSDTLDMKYYDSFRRPFYIHFTENRKLIELLQSNYLKGIVFSYSYFQDLHDKGLFRKFVNNFYQLVYRQIHEKKIEIVLKMNWEDDMFPSFLEYMDFDMITFPINTKVEACYRNVNLEIIEKELHIQKRNIQL